MAVASSKFFHMVQWNQSILNLGVGLTDAGTELTNAGLTQRHNVEGALAVPVDPNAFVTAPAPLSAAVVSMVVLVLAVEVPIPSNSDPLGASPAAEDA